MSELATSKVEPLDDPQVRAYLARIGASDLPEDGAARLRDLQCRHLQTTPFENLSIHLGEPISLSAGDLFDKIVTGRSTTCPCWWTDGSSTSDSAYTAHTHFGWSRGVEQPDPCGTFTVNTLADGDIDVLRDGAPQYRLETRRRTLSDFGPTRACGRLTVDCPRRKSVGQSSVAGIRSGDAELRAARSWVSL